MPFLAIKTNKVLAPEQKERLADRIGELVSIIPNKRKEILMVDVEDGHTLYFRGTINQSCALAALSCYQAAPYEKNKEFTEKMMSVISEELEIPISKIYVTIMEMPVWGSGGTLKKAP